MHVRGVFGRCRRYRKRRLGGLTVRTHPRKCYACGAELGSDDLPMQAGYRGASSRRLYVPLHVQTWCPRGHKVSVEVVVSETID